MVGDGEVCHATDPCASNPCFPGSVCTALHERGVFACGACPKGMIGDGRACRPPFHPCESNPCFAGVACGETNGAFQCGDCPAGMVGDGIRCKGIRVRHALIAFRFH